MRKIIAASRGDLKFQSRHGFYYLYLFVCAFYIILIRSIPGEMRQSLAVMIILTDPAVVGFFFIGGIVLLEKEQRILESLFVTPFKISQYLIAKVISLGLLALVVSLIIIALSLGFQFISLPLILGIILTTVFFTLMGLVLSTRIKSINGYILSSPLIFIFFLPLLEYLNIFNTSLFYLLPVKGSLILMGTLIKKISNAELIYALVILSIWVVIAYYWAVSWFKKYIINEIGGDKR